MHHEELHLRLRVHGLYRLGKPLSPSTHSMKMSVTPRFFNSVTICIQNLAPIGVCLVVVLSASKLLDDSERLAALCFLNFVVIAFAFLFNPRARGSEVFRYVDLAIEAEVMEDCGYGGHPEEWEEAKVQADEALRQHTIWWKVLLASWALLYLVLALKENPDLKGQAAG